MDLKANLWRLRTDKDSEFTGALNQNEFELEAVSGLPASSVLITRVTVLSQENLDWDVMFFRNATASPSTDADLDSLVDWITFATADGVQLAGTGLFRYAVSGLRLYYQPDDGDAHIALVNRNAAAKTAGSGGFVTVELAGPVL